MDHGRSVEPTDPGCHVAGRVCAFLYLCVSWMCLCVVCVRYIARDFGPHNDDKYRLLSHVASSFQPVLSRRGVVLCRRYLLAAPETETGAAAGAHATVTAVSAHEGYSKLGEW